MDNDGGQHAVLLEPGEMVWYESARAIHGRPQPLQGEYYDNLFIHYSPVGDWYTSPYEVMIHTTHISLEAVLIKL